MLNKIFRHVEQDSGWYSNHYTSSKYALFNQNFDYETYLYPNTI